MVSGFAGELDGWFRKARCYLRARPIPIARWPSSDPASPAHLPPRGRLCQRGTTLQSSTTRKSLPLGSKSPGDSVFEEKHPKTTVAAKQTDEGHAAQALRSVPAQTAHPAKKRQAAACLFFIQMVSFSFSAFPAVAHFSSSLQSRVSRRSVHCSNLVPVLFLK